jgi:hypothetical protein
VWSCSQALASWSCSHPWKPRHRRSTGGQQQQQQQWGAVAARLAMMKGRPCRGSSLLPGTHVVAFQLVCHRRRFKVIFFNVFKKQTFFNSMSVKKANMLFCRSMFLAAKK